MTQSETFAVGHLKTGLADNPALRWCAVDLAGPVREATERLDLSPVAAGALARCLSAAVLLQRMTIKTASRLVLGIAGDGPLSRVMAEIENTGDIRGMVSSPQIEIPRANLDDLGVGKAIGSGLLRVWKEEPDFSYESQVAIADGRIGDAVAHFLERSEQTRSAVLLGVLAERKGITAAGGVMLEALPGSADEELAGFESHLETLPSVSKLMADEGLDGLIHRVLAPAGYREIETRTIRYRCRCSGSGIRRFLSNLAEEERGRLKTEAGAYEAECVFCGHRYSFEDLDQTTAPGPETVG